MIDSVTEAYRHGGAMFTMFPKDAFKIVNREIGEFDSLGDAGSFLGVFVPGRHILRVVGGDAPVLFLIGGVEVVRGKPDILSAVCGLDLNDLFDE